MDSETMLINTLTPLGYPIMLQGSLAENDSYPDNFFTYWIDDSEDSKHYDNETVRTNDYISLYFYSISPNNAFNSIKEAKKLLKKQGFIVSGNGYSAYSGKDSHVGRAIDLIYSESEV